MNQVAAQPKFILLNVGRAVHQADWNWRNISSPFIRLHFVESGTAQLIHDNATYDLKKNHLYLTPAYTNHGYKCEGPLTLYYIHIYEEADSQASLFELLDFPVELKADPLVVQLIRRLAAINPGRGLQQFDPWAYDNMSTLVKNIAIQKSMPTGYDMEVQGIIHQLLSRFLLHASDKKNNIDQRILQSLQYIRTNLHQPISLETLAATCFLTKDHFIRLFKQHIGCTPGKYIQEKKIEKAQRIMMTQDVTIKDLAYSLGFENNSYFNRFFRKMTGENPGSRKKKIRSIAGDGNA
ncbi:transcriptional regulator, AraC family [Chitinophaga jiangningensis]|uniref:Transcriptional regulator, AraC family n=1 Tax=Chitinophaga jiangningensis TaxID=1419482 RepID=A0A1M7J8Y4_9BACT|nr:AraC family transcriptional regulator [Chitinophaga jiangningensis]SHM49540.1 transcriptional regulator, AraC family [Chitinophaga jiangningensis]